MKFVDKLLGRDTYVPTGVASVDIEHLLGERKSDSWVGAASLNLTIADFNDGLQKEAIKLGLGEIVFGAPVVVEGPKVHDRLGSFDFVTSATWTEGFTLMGQNFLIEASSQNSQITEADDLMTHPRGTLFGPTDTPSWKTTGIVKRADN